MTTYDPEYSHEYYIKHKEHLQKIHKEWYDKNRKLILFKQKNRYRIKCGLPPLKWKEEDNEEGQS